MPPSLRQSAEYPIRAPAGRSLISIKTIRCLLGGQTGLLRFTDDGIVWNSSSALCASSTCRPLDCSARAIYKQRTAVSKTTNTLLFGENLFDQRCVHLEATKVPGGPHHRWCQCEAIVQCYHINRKQEHSQQPQRTRHDIRCFETTIYYLISRIPEVLAKLLQCSWLPSCCGGMRVLGLFDAGGMPVAPRFAKVRRLCSCFHCTLLRTSLPRAATEAASQDTGTTSATPARALARLVVACGQAGGPAVRSMSTSTNSKVRCTL